MSFGDLRPVSVHLAEQIRFAVQDTIPAHELLQYQLTSWEDCTLPINLVLKVHRGIYGREVHERELKAEFVPTDWWQHFKSRWFPRWAARRWPVRTRRVVTLVKHCHVCPHLNVPSDGREHALFLLDREPEKK